MAGRDLLIIVSDVTRYTGAEGLLPELMRTSLKKARRVRVLFALGNHRKQTEAEQRALVSDSVFDAIPCVDHDCFDEGRLSPLGVTPGGLDVALNSLILWRRRRPSSRGRSASTTSPASVEAGNASYRASPPTGPSSTRTGGFSTGTSRASTSRAQTGILEGNPMHEAIMEGIALIKKPLFLINTIFDDKKRLLNIFSGDIKQSHEAGCAWYHGAFLHRGRRKRRMWSW